MPEEVSLDTIVDRLVDEQRGQLAELARLGFDDTSVRRALETMAGDRLDSGEALHQTRLRFVLLKRLQDEAKSRGIWEYLAEAAGADKDGLVLSLWRAIARSPAWPEELWPRRYYEEHYFDWFLTRGDPENARAVLTDHPAAMRAEWMLIGFVLAAFLVVPTGLLPGWIGVPAAYLGSGLFLALLLRGEKRGGNRPRSLGRAALLAGQSLVPRLAGAVTVGFLALLSGGTLLTWAAGRRVWWVAIAVATLTGIYLLVHIAGKVSPAPGARALWRRWTAIYVCGASHALAVAVIAYPLVLDALGPAEGTPAGGWVEILSLAGYSLFIGMLLHVIWDERPVTRPI